MRLAVGTVAALALASRVLASPPPRPPGLLRPTPAQARRIGERLWANEGKGRPEALVAWNRGEAFASLGIGHFVWYPEGRRGPYTESFPGLVAYLRERDVALPGWLTPATPCPWGTRAALRRAEGTPRLEELRRLLAETVGEQTAFVLRRLDRALPAVQAAAAPARRGRVRTNLERLGRTPEGLFALGDYVNFKGEGTNPAERRAGQGWGLLQVLERMDPTAPCAVDSFASAAREVLEARVAADPTGGERRWRRGWLRRVAGYRRPLDAGGPPPCQAAVLEDGAG